MRVGIFLGSHVPEIGGSFTFQDSLIKALDHVSAEHNFFVFSYMPLEFKKNKIHFISLYEKSLLQRCISYFNYFILRRKNTNKRLNAFCKKYSIELVWFMTQVFEPVDIPYIYTVFDIEHRIHPFFPEVGKCSIWHNRDLNFSMVIPRAAYIICGTEVGKTQISSFYHPDIDRIKVIPFPVPDFVGCDVFCNLEILNKHSIDREYLFYPAQFWPHKNHICLLKTLKLLVVERSLDLLFVFTGSDKGNLSFVRQEAIELGIADRVRFVGFISQDELVVLYKNAFALLYASFFGPDNLPPLEAFALGCPVIAANVEGASEQMGDAALLVNPCDEHEFADAVVMLKNDPELRDMLIIKGIKRAASWTAVNYVAEVFKLFDDFSMYRRCWSRNNEYIQK
jgi:glycosyltransferase involved in cell wall biosynthesis